VIEIARNVLGWADANTTEVDPDTTHKVVIYMPEISKTHMGGTMRLGKRRTIFTDADCITRKLYGNTDYVDERHRYGLEAIIGPLFLTFCVLQTPL
jgi:CTP synthase